ncbi:unnamed protein product [Mytilus coruscus]|uniref:THAP-type domain-containing protein n=1 Tax=Mytilus coruscus TaxID=42192 RepID=A0A6J8DNC2_MYTCO|nr:unnamed protein product [Mytilus coruscus]
MVRRCTWGKCNSDNRYKDRDYMQNVSFWPIPKPATRLSETKLWVKACGRKDVTIKDVNKHSYVCSKHFVEGRPTSSYSYPVSALSTSPFSTVKPCRKPPTRRELFTNRTPKSKSEPRATVPAPVPLSFPSLPIPTKFVEVSSKKTPPSLHTSDVQLQSIEAEHFEVSDTGDHSYTKPVEQRVKIQTNSVSVQTEISFDDMSPYSDGCFKDSGKLKRQFIMEDIFKSDKTCKFYTGLSLAMFTWLYSFLKNKARNMVNWNSFNTNERERSETQKHGPRRILSIKEELAITLIRLRRGFDTKSLGNMFGTSESSVSRIFNTWINLVSHELNFLIRWPSMEQIRNKLPKCFKVLYTTTKPSFSTTNNLFTIQAPQHIQVPNGNNLFTIQAPQHIQVPNGNNLFTIQAPQHIQVPNGNNLFTIQAPQHIQVPNGNNLFTIQAPQHIQCLME